MQRFNLCFLPQLCQLDPPDQFEHVKTTRLCAGDLIKIKLDGGGEGQHLLSISRNSVSLYFKSLPVTLDNKITVTNDRVLLGLIKMVTGLDIVLMEERGGLQIFEVRE